MKVAFCKVATWVDTEVFGQHYYGTICVDRKPVEEVTRSLSAAEAAKLGDGYLPGDESGRFFSEEELKECAINVCRERIPDVEMLVYGDPSIIEPQPILFGPKDIMEEVNKWCEEIGYYDEEWDDIVEAWQEKYDYWRRK